VLVMTRRRLYRIARDCGLTSFGSIVEQENPGNQISTAVVYLFEYPNQKSGLCNTRA
jgi:hypothetical protein